MGEDHSDWGRKRAVFLGGLNTEVWPTVKEMRLCCKRWWKRRSKKRIWKSLLINVVASWLMSRLACGEDQVRWRLKFIENIRSRQGLVGWSNLPLIGENRRDRWSWEEDKLRGKQLKDGLSLGHVASGKSLVNSSFWEICEDRGEYGLWVGHTTCGPRLPEDHHRCPQHPHCGEFSSHHV